jgi:membrane protease YdiL (CAAX protease family)
VEEKSESLPEDAFAAALRGFGLPGLMIFLVILAGDLLFVPLSAMLVLAWARRSRTPLSELGFVRPRSWTVTIGGGIALGVGLKFLMKAFVMPLLGAEPVNPAYHYLAGNRAALPGAVYMMFAAGFGEETLFRGYLFERMGRRYGTDAWGKAIAVLVTTAVFAAAHYSDQGVPGVQQAIVTGLVFGTVYAATGRIGLPMVAHAAFDLTALGMIYWNLETRVAHLIFR